MPASLADSASACAAVKVPVWSTTRPLSGGTGSTACAKAARAASSSTVAKQSLAPITGADENRIASAGQSRTADVLRCAFVRAIVCVVNSDFEGVAARPVNAAPMPARRNRPSAAPRSALRSAP